MTGIAAIPRNLSAEPSPAEDKTHDRRVAVTRLTQLAAEQVPVEVVERLESRMGG